MSREQLRFSPKLLREQGAPRRQLRPYLRLCALVLTLSEVVIGYLLFRRTDFLGCYMMAAYLAKEHVISRFTERGS